MLRPTPSPQSLRRRARVSALLLVAVVLVAGCSAPAKHQASVTEGSAPIVPTGLAADLVPFYSQVLEWTKCGTFQCSTADAPINWDKPSEGTTTLALRRKTATGKRQGSLLINPGGPGGSGVDFVADAVTSFGKRVLAAFDVVGFDPRGVGKSHPVTCVDDKAKDAFISRDFDYTSQAGVDEAIAAYAGFGAACEKNTGALLAHVDTVSAAKDMDLLRAVLGDAKLSYLGYSYGTQLGATYAELFPANVGRLVLDGAVDPTLDSTARGLGQAEGFEKALRAYAADCLAGKDCPLRGTVDEALTQIKDLVAKTRNSPMPTSDPSRKLTGALAFYGIALPLYANQLWPALTQALTAALTEGDGSGLLLLADAYSERQANGTFASNSTEAFLAVGCLDDRTPPDLAAMRQEAAKLSAVAPTLGEAFAYGEVTCAKWPVPVVGGLDSYAAEGAAPIVVIGTTGDPATPYAWAQALAKELSSGVLVTYEGEGHTAYGRSNKCIGDAVDDYLVDGAVPKAGLTC